MGPLGVSGSELLGHFHRAAPNLRSAAEYYDTAGHTAQAAVAREHPEIAEHQLAAPHLLADAEPGRSTKEPHE